MVLLYYLLAKAGIFSGQHKWDAQWVFCVPAQGEQQVSDNGCVWKYSNRDDAGKYFLSCAFRLIEEFMLLANMAVARRIHKEFPDLSLLRRHPPPKQRAADLLVIRNLNSGLVTFVQPVWPSPHAPVFEEKTQIYHWGSSLIYINCPTLFTCSSSLCTCNIGHVDNISVREEIAACSPEAIVHGDCDIIRALP